jgi:DNA-binding SARP family transcriptional activator
MDFRILGPLEVVDDGRKVALGGPRPRALLAILLLHRGEVVPAEQLIDHLYGGRPPRGAVKSLQAHVSRLRKALAGGCNLRTAAGGYALDVEPGSFDLDRFDDLVERGRDALARDDANAASSALTEALALWRGPPLTDFRYDEFAQAEIARLEERRLAVVEDRIDADLALGRHTDLVGEVQVMVAEFPLRERLRTQLMLALYRCGRQADALELYAETRRLLSEELGLEPSDELKKLQRAILEHDPALAPPSRVDMLWSKTPSAQAATAFVGRTAELDELRAVMEDAFVGRGRLVLISGEPGIGKSRLADELLGYARKRRVQMLVGRCWEAGGAPAYWPWVQSLRAYAREADGQALRWNLGAGAPDVAQILPELRELFPDISEPPSLESEGARFRLFDSTATFLRNVTGASPLVLVFDDLHAADEPSLLMLRFVAGEIEDMRILVLGTYRDVDPTVRDPLATTLAELAREPVTRRITLSGLTEPDVARYIELSAGVSPAAELVAQIHAETEGNPLFVGEVVRLLGSEGRLAEDAATGEFAIPEGIREVIGRRLGRLSEGCRRILVLAAVLGREFGLEALGVLSETPRADLLYPLDEAMAARVIGEVPGAPGRLRFAHVLIRETLYDEPTAARRLQLHRQAGEALETLYADDPEPHLAELAHHFVAAAPAGPADKAVDYARGAGDRAVGLLAYEEAARFYEMALGLTEATGLTRCELLLALGDAQARAGDESGAKRTHLHAAELARRLGAAAEIARAALGYGGRFVWARAGTDEHLVPLLREALAALDETDSALRVRVLARLAGALRDQHEREPRAALSAEAVAMARRIGEPASLAYALDGHCMAIFWPENPEERIEIADEVIRLAGEAGDRERVAHARYYRMMFLLELGQMPQVKRELEGYAQLTQELRQPAQLWLLTATRATLALFEGRFEEGEALVSEALRLGQGAQRSDAVLSHRIQTFTLGCQRGTPDGLEEMLEQSVHEYPARPMFRCMLAWLHTELGHEPDARADFEELAADDCAALPRTNEWLFSLGFLAEVARDLRDLRRASTIYELLLPYSLRNASTADYICTGSVSRYLGLLASTMSRWGGAARHFEDALEMNSRMAARPWLAHTQEDYARMLLGRAEPGDTEKAQELLAQAVEAYRELGMDTYAARASAAVSP